MRYLQRGELTEGEKLLLGDLVLFMCDAWDAIKEIRSSKTSPPKARDFHRLKLPDIGRLAEATRKLFFGKAVADVQYSWAGTCRDSDVSKISKSCTLLGPHELGRTTFRDPPWPCEIHINSELFVEMAEWSVEAVVMNILGTMLHEQLHVYCDRVICFGQCEGSKRQRVLCEYLHTQMYHIPGWVLYKGRKVEIFTRGVEHGPVFEAGLHELCETAIKLLESFQATLDPALRLKNISTIHTGAYVKMCRCEDCKNCMLQHYPDQIE
jgi:hypothetical protein